jgi:hypothetical protein
MPVASEAEKSIVRIPFILVTSITDGDIVSAPATGPESSNAWAGVIEVTTRTDAKTPTRMFFISPQ